MLLPVAQTKGNLIASRSCVAYASEIGHNQVPPAAADVWKYQSYDREATSVVSALPCVVRTQVKRRQSCASLWRQTDSIVIGAGSTHNKRDFRFAFRQFPVMFGYRQSSYLDPLLGFVGGGARSNVFNYRQQRRPSSPNIILSIGFQIKT